MNSKHTQMRKVTLENVKPVLFDHVPATQADEHTELNLETISDSSLLEATFCHDLGMDSLEFVLFCFDLERKLGIKIDLTTKNIDFDSKLNLADFLQHINFSLS